MKAIKIITSSLLAVSALIFVGCSSKPKMPENAYVSATTENAMPVADEIPASTPKQVAYLGASSSGLGL